MPQFSRSSKDKLASCHNLLETLFTEVVKGHDCTIVCGHRDQETQDQYFAEGKSKVRYPNGKHNAMPSLAVDVAPFVNGKLSWNKYHCLFFAGYVIRTAEELNIPIRWGGNWDMDEEVMTDQTFQDLVHFELYHPEDE